MTETSGGPRNDVLAERIDGLGRRFSGVEVRLNGLATKDELVVLIKSRDDLFNQRITDLADDVRQLTAALATERAERMAADRENEERVSRSRTLALSAIGAVVAVLGALVLLITNIGAAPS